jgi:hypothetical protein
LDALSDLSSLTTTTSGSGSTSSTSSILAHFFALDFPFCLLIFFCDEGWLSSDESTGEFFLCFLTGVSVSLTLEARCCFEDFLFNDCVNTFGGGLFKRRVACLELWGMVEVLEIKGLLI